MRKLYIEEKSILKAGCVMGALATAIYGALMVLAVGGIIAIIYAAKAIWGTP